jgi:hypothetical protein
MPTWLHQLTHAVIAAGHHRRHRRGEIDFPRRARSEQQSIKKGAAVVLDTNAITLFGNADTPPTLAVAFAMVCHEPSAPCSAISEIAHLVRDRPPRCSARLQLLHSS